jgi:hypothetical protein
MFHQLHHVQNAFLGVSKCESCGASCSGAKTSTFNVSYRGYTKWKLLCFYETPDQGAYSILERNVYGASTPTTWLSTQYKNAAVSGYRGMIVDSTGSSSKPLMILITCGDHYGATSTSRLYTVLQAVS